MIPVFAHYAAQEMVLAMAMSAAEYKCINHSDTTEVEHLTHIDSLPDEHEEVDDPRGFLDD